MEVFKKMWPEAWDVRMEHIQRNVLMALLEQPSATMHHILRMLSDKEYRKQIAQSVQNRPVRRFFEQEYEKFSSSYRTDASAPIQNKVGAFLADPALARMLTTPKREVRIRQVMDEGKVLIANLAKGRIGEDSSSLLGGLLVTTLGLAAYTRVDTPAPKGATSSFISTNFKASRHWPSPTCSRNFESTESGLPSPINFCTS